MSMHGILGETTDYPKTYYPNILYAIPRKSGRDAIFRQNKSIDKAALSLGVDWWHAFEVSWLNLNGISQVAVARFSIAADSPNIVESKSLKLYLNGLNFTQFSDKEAVEQTITNDLSRCVGAQVEVELMHIADIDSTSGLLIKPPLGHCLDAALDGLDDKIKLVDHPDASILANKQQTSTQHQLSVHNNANVSTEPQTYHWYSNLLRSNCPVTNQPDWGTLAIEMTTNSAINEANLLKYILSFRQHNGFHEQCVEQVFADLTHCFKPSRLMVRAWYTRRGGIDINPCRVSELSLLPKPSRLVRQ